MHSAIFVALPGPQRQGDWTTFLARAKENEKITQYAERLAEGVWLVNFRECPAALSFLICHAETTLAISYKLLPLPDPPEWLPAGPDPTSIPGRNERS